MNLTKTAVDKLAYSKTVKPDITGGKAAYSADYYWDDQIKGFGVRVYPSGKKSFVITYRNQTNSKRFFTLGDYGVLTVTEARDMPKKKLAEVLHGDDPQAEREEKRKEITFIELSHQYLNQVKGHKRSWKKDEQRLRDHILPVIGKRKLTEITYNELVNLIIKIKDKTSPSTANRCIALIKHMLKREMDEQSPAKKLKIYPEPPSRDIVLTVDEIHRLIEACDVDENIIISSLFKMAMFTGRRPGELKNAKWQDVNLERRIWRLPHTKAGEQQYVPLNDLALSVLQALPRKQENPFVFYGEKEGKSINFYHRAWLRIVKRAKITYIPPYGLRHNYASMLIGGGVPLATVQPLMGHKSITTTMRYAHHRPDHLFDGTGRFGDIISFNAEKKKRIVVNE